MADASASSDLPKPSASFENRLGEKDKLPSPSGPPPFEEIGYSLLWGVLVGSFVIGGIHAVTLATRPYIGTIVIIGSAKQVNVANFKRADQVILPFETLGNVKSSGLEYKVPGPILWWQQKVQAKAQATGLEVIDENQGGFIDFGANQRCTAILELLGVAHLELHPDRIKVTGCKSASLSGSGPFTVDPTVHRVKIVELNNKVHLVRDIVSIARIDENSDSPLVVELNQGKATGEASFSWNGLTDAWRGNSLAPGKIFLLDVNIQEITVDGETPPAATNWQKLPVEGEFHEAPNQERRLLLRNIVLTGSKVTFRIEGRAAKASVSGKDLLGNKLSNVVTNRFSTETWFDFVLVCLCLPLVVKSIGGFVLKSLGGPKGGKADD